MQAQSLQRLESDLRAERDAHEATLRDAEASLLELESIREHGYMREAQDVSIERETDAHVQAEVGYHIKHCMCLICYWNVAGVSRVHLARACAADQKTKWRNPLAYILFIMYAAADPRIRVFSTLLRLIGNCQEARMAARTDYAVARSGIVWGISSQAKSIDTSRCCQTSHG